MKRLLPLLLLFLPLSNALAQSYLLTLTDSTLLDHIDTLGDGSTQPRFIDPNMDAAINAPNIIQFNQYYPEAPYECLRQIWHVRGVDSGILNNLHALYPQAFPKYELLPEAEPTGYTPNDWNPWCKYLHIIGAENAWNDSLYLSHFGMQGTHGDSSVIIGITDTYFDLNNHDLQTKIVRIGPNNPPYGSEYWGHGTGVAGMAAGATDNGAFFPSIGFNCRLDLSTIMDDSTMLTISQNTIGGKRKVINGSWLYATREDFDPVYSTSDLYTAIYENGITACFGAGNGRPNVELNTSNFCYPASYDHNLSITGICTAYDSTYGHVELEDIHEYWAGDSTQSFQHNTRVDLGAPGISIGGLSSNETDTSVHTTNWFGTSFSSPIVAGTAALLYSVKPCLTPYQVEWILKTTSRDIYNMSYGGQYYNQKYAGPTRYTGRIGAGRLQADSAVFKARNFECNDPATQTMYIEAINISHLCAPGTAPGVSFPTLSAVIKNGTPPYTYRWDSVAGNTSLLSSYTSPRPQIISYTTPGEVYYRLSVYSSDEIQKVAHKYFKLKLIDTMRSDLAMRDSYVDMLDEPNTQYIVNSKMFDIWHSPDIWNRDTMDGGFEHQNPQYFTTGNPNYIYVRVRNVGCAAVDQDQARLKLYWTLSSTGEHWKYDWDGSTLLPASVKGNFINAGGMITDTVVIPHLNPGDSFIVAVPWHPIDPNRLSGSPKNADACILARIIETNRNDTGLHSYEVTRTATNVNENNNIATFNLNIINLGRACATCRILGGGNESHRLYVANAEGQDQDFTLEMLSQKDIEQHLSGDISKYCYVTLALDSLYDRWQASGGNGNYMSKDLETKTVTYDPSSPLRLSGINLHPGEHFPVDVTFVLRSGVTIPYDVNDFKLYIRQLINEGKGNRVYGAVVYSLNIAANDSAQQRRAQQTGTNSQTGTSSYYTAYPNPVSGNLTIRYSGMKNTLANFSLTDISGKLLISRHNISMQPGSAYYLKMNALPPGSYLLYIEDTSGNRSSQQLTKQ